MWGKGNSFVLWVGMQISAASVESSMETPEKIKNASALLPSDLTSGNMSEGTQNTNSKELKHPYIHYGVTNNSQDLKAAQVSISK